MEYEGGGREAWVKIPTPTAENYNMIAGMPSQPAKEETLTDWIRIYEGPERKYITIDFAARVIVVPESPNVFVPDAIEIRTYRVVLLPGQNAQIYEFIKAVPPDEVANSSAEEKETRNKPVNLDANQINKCVQMVTNANNLMPDTLEAVPDDIAKYYRRLLKVAKQENG